VTERLSTPATVTVTVTVTVTRTVTDLHGCLELATGSRDTGPGQSVFTARQLKLMASETESHRPAPARRPWRLGGGAGSGGWVGK
jgi:hypothetical protein